ncbi:DUF481 domain-containing protein [Pelagicoccus mobilis]|uniref:DUF481 domain-containing protein n=1 Tax=Pelagicoccus mobilis TaxID=415221 RepID=A0A934S0G9_9BACT|nr:DUF481 domain-containing protein [Pelagicoccus mobilis]MBK1876843.1 DUF481 domain-containing protein [Pelagicoccus mobilis]
MQTRLSRIIASLIVSTLSLQVAKTEELPSFVQKDSEWDWLELDTGEWLKGRVKTMYDGDLEFDSDHFGVITISWDDVKRLKSSGTQTVRMRQSATQKFTTEQNPKRPDLLSGQTQLNTDTLIVKDGPTSASLSREDVLGLVSNDKSDQWSFKLSLGGNFRSGNTDVNEYNIRAEVDRRTVSTRLNLAYLGNFADSDSIETANNHRLWGYYDYFFTSRIFVRPIGFEYFKDPFQNLDSRITAGGSFGYKLVDGSDLSMDLSAGPAIQWVRFDTVAPDSDDSTDNVAAVSQLDLDWEISKNLDFIGTYSLQYAPDEAGGLSLFTQNTFQYELSGNVDLETSFIWDRTQSPVPDASGQTPDKDDFRVILGIGIEL